MNICPHNESLAAKEAVRNLKLGKRRSYAERVQASRIHDDRSVIVAFPIPAAALPAAASN
jgi:hypothetical protein